MQTIFVHLPMYFHPNRNEMNSLLEGVSGFSFTKRQCFFIKVEILSGLKGNVFNLMKFWKRKYLAGQILGFEIIIHFLTPSHYLFFLTVKPLLSYQSRLFFVTFLWLTLISDNPHNSFQHQNVKTQSDCFLEKMS